MCQSGFFPSGNIHLWEIYLPKNTTGEAGMGGWQVRDAGVSSDELGSTLNQKKKKFILKTSISGLFLNYIIL